MLKNIIDHDEFITYQEILGTVQSDRTTNVSANRQESMGICTLIYNVLLMIYSRIKICLLLISHAKQAIDKVLNRDSVERRSPRSREYSDTD